MVCYFRFVIKNHQNTHLICWHRHFILFGSLISNFGSYFSISLIKFPVKLSTRKLWHVVLFENTHALFYLLWDLNEIYLWETLILGRRITTFIRPVTRCKNFYIQINRYLLACWTFSKIWHSLFRHFDIFEHYFKSLSKLKSTFFF